MGFIAILGEVLTLVLRSETEQKFLWRSVLSLLRLAHLIIIFLNVFVNLRFLWISKEMKKIKKSIAHYFCITENN